MTRARPMRARTLTAPLWSGAIPVMVVVFAALGIVALAGAAPLRVVQVPGFNNLARPGVAVDRAGQGVLVFTHGEHARLTWVGADGRITRPAEIAAPRAPEGVRDLSAAINERGQAVVGYTLYDGYNPQVGPGYGFRIRPYAARARWGHAVSPAQVLDDRVINADGFSAAIGRTGVAAFAYGDSSQSTSNTSPLGLGFGFEAGAALWLPGRAPVRLVKAEPASCLRPRVEVAGSGFAWRWLCGSLAHAQAASGLPSTFDTASTPKTLGPNSGPLGDGKGGTTVITAGRQVLHWARGASAPTTGKTLGAVGETPITATASPTGTFAVLLADQKQRSLRVVIGRPGVAAVRSLQLPNGFGSSRSPFDDGTSGLVNELGTLAFSANGDLLVAYSSRVGHPSSRFTISGTRVARIRDRRLSVIASSQTCGPLRLAAGAGGRGLLALSCLRDVKKNRWGGAVMAIPGSAR